MSSAECLMENKTSDRTLLFWTLCRFSRVLAARPNPLFISLAGNHISQKWLNCRLVNLVVHESTVFFVLLNMVSSLIST